MRTRLRAWPRSLVGRVFMLYTGVLVAIVSTGLGLFYSAQFNGELEDARQRADTLAAVVVPLMADSAVIGDYDTIRRALERTVQASDFAMASFIDLKGGVVAAPYDRAPAVQPPRWLVQAMAARLWDINQPVVVGGRDYGVLRFAFSPERIAGHLWQQTRMVLWLALSAVLLGLLLIRWPLVRWLGNLGRIQAFERAMLRGQASPEMLAGDEVPLEFRQTFDVLGRAAASLQAQRARADVTLGAIADGVFTLDDMWCVVYANPAACAMLGLPQQAPLGQRADVLLPQVFAAGDASTQWANRRVQLVREGGSPLVLDTTLSPILGPGGTAVGYVLACRDVSEQHALDQRLRDELQAREAALVTLRRLLEELMQRGTVPGVAPGTDDLQAISAMISALVMRVQERGDQLDAIFALSPDGFVSFDAQHRANYVSPAFERLTGLQPASVLGHTDQAIEAALRERCAAAAPWRGLQALQEAQRAHADGAAPQRLQIELQRPVKRVLDVGLREGSTPAVSQVLSLRDVTHETEVDQMKSEFLSTAAHELRTPMASIFGFAELMLRRPLRAEQQQEALATIHRQTALMISIVNELLDLARIEARRGKDFELQTLDLRDLAAQAVHDFKPPQDRPQPLLQLGGLPSPVRVDRNKMAQALGNVLSNAYKYSPGGGAVELHVVHDGAAAGGRPLRAGLRVRDHGIGMTPEQLARVSERFYRADDSGAIPGTGLGMSIVKEIIELLGGRMDLESQPGAGTTVTLWLPLVAEPASSADPLPKDALACTAS